MIHIRKKRNLAIDEFKNFNRNAVELIIQRTNNGLHSALNGLNAGLQWTGPVLRIAINIKETLRGSKRRRLNELQILQPLLLCPSRLHKTKNPKQFNQRIPTNSE